MTSNRAAPVIHLSLLCAAGLAASIHGALAREAPEHLVQALPAGFAQVDSRSQPGMDFVQYAPQGETVKTWTRAIITQAFASNDPPLPQRYGQFLIDQWTSACPEGAKPVFATGFASGRPAGTLELDCAKSPATGKPEHTFFQIIRGTGALFIAQYAFRSEPSAAEKSAAVTYLQSVHLDGSAPYKGK